MIEARTLIETRTQPNTTLYTVYVQTKSNLIGFAGVPSTNVDELKKQVYQLAKDMSDPDFRMIAKFPFFGRIVVSSQAIDYVGLSDIQSLDRLVNSDTPFKQMTQAANFGAIIAGLIDYLSPAVTEREFNYNG